MELPSKTLLSLLEDHWELTETGLAAKDIQWTRVDWHLIDKSVFAPHVVARIVSFRRIQEADSNMYEFNIGVQAVLWSQSVGTLEDDEEKHWKIVEQIKKLVEVTASPSGWHGMFVSSGANPSVLEVLPNVYVINLVVTARIAWSGS